MRVYLIRHAHAIDLANDAERPLSARGREEVRALAAFLRRSGLFQPQAIWQSPLRRSLETAELLVQGLGLAVPRAVRPDLAPEADPLEIARAIKAGPDAIALVGHEPHLSALATFLIKGDTAPPVFVMQKCSALALDGEGAYWSVRWHLSPELLA